MVHSRRYDQSQATTDTAATLVSDFIPMKPSISLRPRKPILMPKKRPSSRKTSYDEEASRISDMIDEEIKQDSIHRSQRKNREVKVMLLGQAESGKSTLQKQFQLHYASSTLDHERPSWRPVVYFNILKAVRMIFDELDYELSSSASKTPSASTSVSDESAVELPSANGSSGDVRSEISQLRSKLLPLIALEDSLASELSGGVHVSGGRTGVFVRSGWQALVTPNRSWPKADFRKASSKVDAVANLVAKTLGERQAEMEELWRHPAVQTLLQLRRLRLDESAPFFLDHIDRISEPDYLPSTGDILNVRLQTLGVKEHRLNINLGGTRYDWLMYDVGGARGQRHAWVPYFDDGNTYFSVADRYSQARVLADKDLISFTATAIIFLAPISAFDQYLEEDPRTNRIDDSLQLFTAICSNKLLKNAHLVILLNKADLLRKKLEAGIKVRKFITSFGDRPNSYEEVSEYFKAHFIQVHRRKDISRRSLYLHFTTMLDVEASQRIVATVGEAVLRSYIAQTGLL